MTLMIAAYNEEQVVKEKMENSRQLNYPKEKLKIMWVTDGSTDRTNELLKEYPEADVLYQPERKGKTAALNRAIDFVKSPIVVFTDANTMINKGAVREIVKKFVRRKVDAWPDEKRVEAERKRTNAAGGGEGIYWKYESVT
uniref:Glycos_transf_2 n=1 Tax=uncultured Parabacteroides sp. TaxID=512312 RepID=A0A060BT13_9BACT|nr:Glycos_transf_2 [uncultured Parabacteroides sp.]